MTRFLCAVALCVVLNHCASAVELLRWERVPLPVRLLVGQERVVFVDRNVRVGVPESVDEVLKVQSVGGALYLKADAPLAKTRLQVQDAENGAIVLLDVIAEPAAPGESALEPMRVVYGTAGADRTDSDASGDATETVGGGAAKATTPVAVLLTRYAAQSLYSPLRTVAPVPGLTAVPIQRGMALDTLMPTVSVEAKALASWRLGDHWVTAIKLTNTSDRIIELDPRTLQGTLAAATFQHSTVGPARDSTDTTVVYVVTRGNGLAGNLLPNVAPVDAALNLPLGTGGKR